VSKGAKRREAEILLKTHLAELGFRDIREQFKFLPDRRFTFDLAIPEIRMAFECDGGQFNGGHRRGEALAKDYEKQNLAQLNGWRILRFVNRDILNGAAKEFLEENLL